MKIKFKISKGYIAIFGIFVGLIIALFSIEIVHVTSNEKFCASCHSMTPFADSYRKDIHGGNNRSGTKASCTDCHLPHTGTIRYLAVKAKTGIQDVYYEVFHDTAKIDWIKNRANAKDYVYDSGCLKCHSNLEGMKGLSPAGKVLHKTYLDGKGKNNTFTCVGCHSKVGHKDLEKHIKGYFKQ